ncbi:polyprenyl diphosphate synthase [Sorangium sp. So ce1099]|uniref:polyprenyl diphosphate synthase n=1 Tax=Sorangium sp. So ce1099 TaxID=3133331 RepID=UPI003F5F3A72
MNLVEARNLPRHVGIIMDGNGRWAELRGEPREAGHKAGSAAVRRIVRVCRRLGVEALTLYAFSEQNWARPRNEVDALMGLLREFLMSERGEILENDIRLVAIGDISRLPEVVREVLDPLRKASSANMRMTLALALSYGAREEIAAAARELAMEAVAGRLDPEAIDGALLAARLPSLSVGEPDLIIRTGGEQRLSNFLLYGAAYAELSFTERLWPDFTEDDLFAAIATYQQRDNAVEPAYRAEGSGGGAGAGGGAGSAGGAGGAGGGEPVPPRGALDGARPWRARELASHNGSRTGV